MGRPLSIPRVHLTRESPRVRVSRALDEDVVTEVTTPRRRVCTALLIFLLPLSARRAGCNGFARVASQLVLRPKSAPDAQKYVASRCVPLHRTDRVTTRSAVRALLPFSSRATLVREVLRNSRTHRSMWPARKNIVAPCCATLHWTIRVKTAIRQAQMQGQRRRRVRVRARKRVRRARGVQRPAADGRA